MKLYSAGKFRVGECLQRPFNFSTLSWVCTLAATKWPPVSEFPGSAATNVQSVIQQECHDYCKFFH